MKIAVAGCGIGGMAAAILLARQGHSVSLFERFERPRPLGSGLMLQPTGLAVLDRMGLAGPAVAAGARIDRLLGLSGTRCVLDVRYANLSQIGLRGFGIHRARLFDLLHDALQREPIDFRFGLAVRRWEAVEDGRIIFFDGDASSEPFDLVVDAMGTRSPLASVGGRDLPYGALWASVPLPTAFDSSALEQRYRRASQMVGVMPMGDGKAAFFWSLRADQLSAWRDAPLDRWKDEVVALWPRCAPVVERLADHCELTFARYAHRTVARPVGERIAHIGDSWHAASPQLGQGANMALLDAWALAQALEDGGSLPERLRGYVRRRSDHVRAYQALSRWLTPVYQSDGTVVPWLRDRAIGPLSQVWPARKILAGLVAGLFGAPLAGLGLTPYPSIRV